MPARAACMQRRKPRLNGSSRPSRPTRSEPANRTGATTVTELLITYMAPIMFGSLVLFLLLGYPAAFSLGAVGLMYALIGVELGLFQPNFLQALPERVYGVMNNDTLLAI